ncbi:MAG: PepSY-associated TM helix domain-containing protein [Polyangiales bacterium]
MRRISMLLHRWLGLFTALFLAMAGLTGAMIAWDHELDHWLNPQLFRAQDQGPVRDPLQLANELEAKDARFTVSYLPLKLEEGDALDLHITPHIDPRTKQLYELGFTEIMLDPATGRRLGQREWGAFSLARESIMPFLYKLHYTLHLPMSGTLDFGMLVMGIIAIVWFLDAFIALYISFPSRKVWKKSFAFRFDQGTHKMTFDLHRSSGVWLWPILFVFAFTAVTMNLGDQLIEPIVNAISPLTKNPWDTEPNFDPPAPKVSREQALALGKAAAAERGITEPIGSIFYSAQWNFYSLNFHVPGAEHGDGGLGNRALFFDAQTGAMIRDREPAKGSAGDLFMAAQFPLHSGRLFGTGGRIFVSLLGLIIFGLSFTGVWLWAKKRLAQGRAAARNRAPAANVIDSRI